MQYSLEDCDKFTEVKLVDFSNSFFISDPPATVDTIDCQLLLETIFKEPLSKVVDIWGLACATYWLVTGRELFILCFNSDKRGIVA